MPDKPVEIVTELPAGAVAESHQVAVLVQVLEEGEVVEEINEVTDGSVTLDSNAATRGRLDLTLVDDGSLGLVPETPDSLLAPYGNELRASRGIEFADRIELVRLGIFRIDEADVEDSGDNLQIRINGMDRSARVIDAKFEEPYEVAKDTLFTAAIEAVLRLAIPDVEIDFAASSLMTPKLLAEEGEDSWAFAQGLATAMGGELYFNRDGMATLRPVPSGGDPVAEFVEGEGGVLLPPTSRRWTRQGAFNRVIATGENTGNDTAVRGVATDDNPLSPTYYFGPFGKSPRFYNSQYITTEAQADDAAAGILAKEMGTTRQVNFGVIVDPARSPSDVVRITRERAAIDEDHVIDSLTIPLGAEGTMSGGTRAIQVQS